LTAGVEHRKTKRTPGLDRKKQKKEKRGGTPENWQDGVLGVPIWGGGGKKGSGKERHTNGQKKHDPGRKKKKGGENSWVGVKKVWGEKRNEGPNKKKKDQAKKKKKKQLVKARKLGKDVPKVQSSMATPKKWGKKKKKKKQLNPHHGLKAAVN